MTISRETQVMPQVTAPMFAPSVAPSASPFGGSVVAREIQVIQGAIISAKMYPRDRNQAFDRIVKDCGRIGLAEVASYAFPRGKETVSGPSIRLAEMIAQNWGNMRFGFQEHRRVGESDVTAFCWDIETNVYRPAEFTVRHWRDTKSGGYPVTAERDIYELVANQAQRRVRGCILALIPGDVIEAAERECERTLAGKGDLQTKQKAIVASFAELKVSERQLVTYLGKNIQSITHLDAIKMRKIYTSLKDGMTGIDDWFEPDGDPEQRKQAGQTGDASNDAPPIVTGQQVADSEVALKDFNAALDDAHLAGVDAQKLLPKPIADIKRLKAVEMRAAAQIVRAQVKAELSKRNAP